MFALPRNRVLFAIAALGVSLTAISPAPALAQFSGSNTTPVGDKSLLRPPAGARVAIFEFEDLECPDCARAYPLLKEAAAKYDIPWVKHDFPLPFHVWSFQAAVNARWFDSKSKKLGDDYREAIFANQPSIATTDDLRSFTEKFATIIRSRSHSWSIRKASLRLMLRRIMPWASALASSTPRPSGL